MEPNTVGNVPADGGASVLARLNPYRALSLDRDVADAWNEETGGEAELFTDHPGVVPFAIVTAPATEGEVQDYAVYLVLPYRGNRESKTPFIVFPIAHGRQPLVVGTLRVATLVAQFTKAYVNAVLVRIYEKPDGTPVSAVAMASAFSPTAVPKPADDVPEADKAEATIAHDVKWNLKTEYYTIGCDKEPVPTGHRAGYGHQTMEAAFAEAEKFFQNSVQV